MKADIESQFIQACTDHSDALFRYCFFKTRSKEMSKDLVQETYMKTWNYLVKGQSIDNMRAFFYKTLTNLIIDEYRKKKTVSLDELEEIGLDQSTNDIELYYDKLDAEKALLVLDEIGGSYKDVIIMRYVQDLSLKEISDITGESENSLSVKIHRGLKKIKIVLKAKDEKTNEQRSNTI